MQANIFLFLTIVFVVANTGQGYVPRVQPEQYYDTSEISAPLASVSSTNGSTLEDIMQELGRTEIQQTGCQFSAGSYGGGGGGAFNELPDKCRARIRKIKIRSGSRIDSIQVTYRLSNGRDSTGGRYGGNGGSLHTIDINTNGGENVIGVFGKSGGAVDQLGFVTNKGRIFGPYGGCGGGYFHVHSCFLRGIYGRSGSRIDSIGFFCSHL